MFTTLRPGVQRRLGAQRRTGPGKFVDLKPRWGSDVTGCLHLEVDATGWVTDVRVDSVPDDLRHPASLEAAVRSAIASARWQHLRAEADQQVHTATKADLDRGRALVEGRARVRTPKVRHLEPVSVDEARNLASRRDLAVDRPDERLFRRTTGSSRDGEITVVLGWVDGLQTITVDADWLRATTASMLRFALREAFTAASDAGDEQS